MTVFIAAAPWVLATYGYAVLVPGIVASGLITIAATTLAAAVPPRTGLLVVLGLGLLMRLIAIGFDPLLSTDIYRYVWDGRVQAAGINPFAHVPADPALAALRDAAIYPNINRADYAVTAYPPVAQLFFLAVTRIAETLTAMRLAMVSCEIVIVAVIVDLLRRARLPAVAVVAWVWHPLAIWEVANNAHVEALMVALLMLGVWLLVCSRERFGAVAMAMATLVKPYAVLALPAFWRPWDWRVPLAAVVTAGLCYLPYAGAGRGVLGYLASGYLSEEGLASGEGFWLPGLVQVAIGNMPGLTTAYLVAAALTMAWLALRTPSHLDASPAALLQRVALLLMVGLFLLSPNYPWYVLAVVPFTVLGGGVPAWAMTLGAILLYRPWLLPENDLAWKTLATLPVIVAAAYVLAWRRRDSASFQGASQWTS